MDVSKPKKIILSKYEVSMLGMLILTLLPAFGVLAVQIIGDVLTGSLNNIRIYIVTGIVFLAALILSGLLCRRYARAFGVSYKACCIGYALLFIIYLLLLAKCYLNSSTVYPCQSGQWFPWHSKADWKMFLFMTGIGTAGILISLWAEKKKKLLEIVRFPAYLLASATAGASMYCGNFLASDKLHGNAYYTSVYNALMNAPYDYSNQSIYGHYAIFLKYPVKLFGGSYTAFNIVMSLVGGLSVFMLALALDICLQNHFISIIGVWSIPVMYFYYPQNHWQMFPHRVVFAGIILYLLARYFHKKSRRTKAFGYIICSLSLLWNVETGIVCLGVWALASIVHDNFYEKTAISWKALASSIVKNTAYSMLSVFGTVFVFNLYNMPLGEGWHGLRFLLFPHISTWDMPGKLTVQAAEQIENAGRAGMIESLKALNSGFASGLTISFPIQISPWYFVFLLMGMAVVLLVVKCLYAKAGANDYVMGLTAVLALGNLVYFINRPCFDYLAIAFLEAVLIMGIRADETVDRKEGLAFVKISWQLLFIAILSVLSILSIWQSMFRLSDRTENGYYDRAEFNGLLDEISQTVPEDTFAFGPAIQEIYGQLGWDTGCYFVDYSSIDGNNHSIATIIIETAEQEECVVSIRDKKSGDRTECRQYMSYWGFPEEAIDIKAHWEYDVDEAWYWDIYYIGIDKGIENRTVKKFEKLYQNDRQGKRENR